MEGADKDLHSDQTLTLPDAELLQPGEESSEPGIKIVREGAPEDKRSDVELSNAELGRQAMAGKVGMRPYCDHIATIIFLHVDVSVSFLHFCLLA